MNTRRRDPYEKEREAEYADYKRFTIRAFPALVCACAIYLNLELTLLDKIRDLFIVAAMYELMNYCYSKLAKDSIIFSIVVLLVWSWLIYEWWFVEGVNFIGAFLPSVGLLLIVAKLLRWHDIYKNSKTRQYP